MSVSAARWTTAIGSVPSWFRPATREDRLTKAWQYSLSQVGEDDWIDHKRRSRSSLSNAMSDNGHYETNQIPVPLALRRCLVMMVTMVVMMTMMMTMVFPTATTTSTCRRARLMKRQPARMMETSRCRTGCQWRRHQHRHRLHRHRLHCLDQKHHR